MGLDRGRPDPQAVCDLDVDQTLRHQDRHLALTRGQGAGGPARRGLHGGGRHQLLQHCRGERALAVGSSADRLQDLLRGAVLEEEADRPGPQGRGYEAVGVEGCEHQDFDLGYEFTDLLAGPYPVAAGHVEVQQDDVRAQAASRIQGALPVRRLAQDGQVRIALQDQAQGGADEGLVVGDDDADAVSHEAVPSSVSSLQGALRAG